MAHASCRETGRGFSTSRSATRCLRPGVLPQCAGFQCRDLLSLELRRSDPQRAAHRSWRGRVRSWQSSGEAARSKEGPDNSLEARGKGSPHVARSPSRRVPESGAACRRGARRRHPADRVTNGRRGWAASVRARPRLLKPVLEVFGLSAVLARQMGLKSLLKFYGVSVLLNRWVRSVVPSLKGGATRSKPPKRFEAALLSLRAGRGR